MIASRPNARAGFTLLELLIGVSLSLIIMSAVLSSYVLLGRNFSRSLGVSANDQPPLDSQGRRTLAIFAQDVRMAGGFDTTGVSPMVAPSATGLTLMVSTNAGPKYVTYYYNGPNASADVTFANFTIPANALVRIDLNTNTAQTLHTHLLTCAFGYYDTSGQSYAILDPTMVGFSSFSGIKQLSLAFTAQAGSATNGTLTQVYSSASPRLLLRNKQLLP